MAPVYKRGRGAEEESRNPVSLRGWRTLGWKEVDHLLMEGFVDLLLVCGSQKWKSALLLTFSSALVWRQKADLLVIDLLRTSELTLDCIERPKKKTEPQHWGRARVKALLPLHSVVLPGAEGPAHLASGRVSFQSLGCTPGLEGCFERGSPFLRFSTPFGATQSRCAGGVLIP